MLAFHIPLLPQFIFTYFSAFLIVFLVLFLSLSPDRFSHIRGSRWGLELSVKSRNFLMLNVKKVNFYVKSVQLTVKKRSITFNFPP